MEFILYHDPPDMLQIRAHWGRLLNDKYWGRVLVAVNDHNRGFVLPKMYVDRNERAELFVFVEHTVYHEHGATDQQLLSQVVHTITLSLEAFGRLDAQFPVAAAER